MDTQKESDLLWEQNTQLKSGQLTAIAQFPIKKINSYPAWLCKCECGNYAVVSEFALTVHSPSKQKTSCGCNGERKAQIVIPRDKKYGRLQIIEFTGKFIKDEPLFLCMCDCGTTIEVELLKLRRNKIHSCGCLASENATRNLTEFLVEDTNIQRISRSKALSNNRYSKVIGVSWNEQKQRWHAILSFNKVKVLNKYYVNYDEAVAARKRAEKEYFEPIIIKYGEHI